MSKSQQILFKKKKNRIRLSDTRQIKVKLDKKKDKDDLKDNLTNAKEKKKMLFINKEDIDWQLTSLQPQEDWESIFKVLRGNNWKSKTMETSLKN